MDTSLLLVDPDVALSETLAPRLRDAGFTVDVEPDGNAALERLATGTHACLVTELDLGALSGLDLCRRIRANPRIGDLRIVVHTARADEIDRVVAFEVGVDDYVLKPCSWRELALRIRARLRPAAPSARIPPPFRIAGLEFDLRRFRVSVDGTALPLTNIEVALLLALASHDGGVVRRDALIQEVWEAPLDGGGRTLDTHIGRLRDKLGPYADRLQTIRGSGYRLVSI